MDEKDIDAIKELREFIDDVDRMVSQEYSVGSVPAGVEYVSTARTALNKLIEEREKFLAVCQKVIAAEGAADAFGLNYPDTVDLLTEAWELAEGLLAGEE